MITATEIKRQVAKAIVHDAPIPPRILLEMLKEAKHRKIEESKKEPSKDSNF